MSDTSIGYIDTQLRLDFTGKILLNYGVASRKDQINTYLGITTGQLPFNTFGNNMLNMIFESASEANIKIFLNQLIIDISYRFQVAITDYDATISVDKIYIKLYITYDNIVDTISFIIQNSGQVLL